MRAEKALAPGKLARRTAKHANATSQIAENRRNTMRKSLREAIVETFDTHGFFRNHFEPECRITQRLFIESSFWGAHKDRPGSRTSLLVLNVKRLWIQPEHFLGG